MKAGLLRLNKNGRQLGMQASGSMSSDIDVTWLTALPGSLAAMAIDENGNMSTQPLGSGGTVSSVALSLPSIFGVTGSPVTTSGTLTATFNSQAQNLVFASPNGSSGTPTFRSLVAADIPTLTSAKISDFDTQVRLSRLDQMAVPTASVNLNSQKITGLADPTNAQDAVTKTYADALISTGNNKGTVRVASTANVTIASPGSAIDGVTLSTNDLVLLKDQSTASQNGLYVFNGAASALTRTTNADTSAEVKAGLFVFVSEGTANGNNGYTLTTDDPITLGTTSLTFTQTSGAGQITAGTGLTKTGNQIDVGGTTDRITINADTVDIASTYVGQTSITTLGTIATGTWQGTAIAVAYGGTGATTAANARSNLGVSGVYKASFTNSSLVAGVLTLTHNLAQYVAVQIFDNSNKMIIPDEVTLSSSTQCTVDLTNYGTITGTWNAVVIG